MTAAKQLASQLSQAEGLRNCRTDLRTKAQAVTSLVPRFLVS